MPSKQDIAIAKGLAKEAGKMVAEELAKMLIPGIGWVTGLVSVVKLVRALNDPGDESRPVELALRVSQDARFCIRLYDRAAKFYVLDFYDVNKGPSSMPKTLGHNAWGKSADKDRNLLRVGSGFVADKFNTAGKVTQKLGYSKQSAAAFAMLGDNPDRMPGFVVGYHRSIKRDLELISTGPDVLVAQLIASWPELKQYETDLLAGAAISLAALKVSASADLFDADMKPKFGESNPSPLIQYGEALVQYVELVKRLGTYPAGLASFGDQISQTALLGEVASQIATAFGLDLASDFVTFKAKAGKGESIADLYRAKIGNEVRNIPETNSNVVISFPGDPLQRAPIVEPPSSLPEVIYTTMPIVQRPSAPSVIAVREDGSIVTSRDLVSLPIQNTLAPALTKPQQQLGKLGLLENVSAESKPSTEDVGRTDSSVLVLLAAAAAAVALL